MKRISDMFFRLFTGLSAFTALVSARAPSRGCGSPLPDGQQPGSFHDAFVGDRRYVVFIPPEYSISNPAALILSYHGGSQDPENQIDLDLFTAEQYNTDKFVVYPEGTSRPNCADDNSCGKRYWSIDPDIDADDVSFTSSILEALQETYCLDTDRLFASGKSQGGGLIGNILACDNALSTTLAAFAPVSGAFYTDADPCEPPFEFDIPCSPGRNNVAMIEFHGGKDTTAPYDGGPRRGQCLPHISWWVKSWAVNDELDTDGETEQLAEDTPNTTITRYGGGLVSHVFDAVIGHDWPATSENSDNEGDVAEFNATPIIIDFFDAHPL